MPENEEKEKEIMTIKDVCTVAGLSLNIIVYTRLKYSRGIAIPCKSDVINIHEFIRLVKSSESFSNTQVDGLTIENESLCIFIDGKEK